VRSDGRRDRCEPWHRSRHGNGIGGIGRTSRRPQPDSVQVAGPEGAADFPVDAWDEVLEVNLSAPFFLTQSFGRQMLQRGRGKVIFLASVLSFQGGITAPAYAASKGGIAQLAKAFANEWAAHGINVNAVAPGYVVTEMTEPLLADPERRRQITERIPAGRWASPDEVARAVLFLASNLSDYVHGAVLSVDGGWMGR
jgi:2-deoxy-D-gluconate 3-dehydrogenase